MGFLGQGQRTCECPMAGCEESPPCSEVFPSPLLLVVFVDGCSFRAIHVSALSARLALRRTRSSPSTEGGQKTLLQLATTRRPSLSLLVQRARGLLLCCCRYARSCRNKCPPDVSFEAESLLHQYPLPAATKCFSTSRTTAAESYALNLWIPVGAWARLCGGTDPRAAAPGELAANRALHSIFYGADMVAWCFCFAGVPLSPAAHVGIFRHHVSASVLDPVSQCIRCSICRMCGAVLVPAAWNTGWLSNVLCDAGGKAS